tara:strand:+ start:1054 stop:1278 length:225 start_codon:yes stop_codon:yes gene_type:complete
MRNLFFIILLLLFYANKPESLANCPVNNNTPTNIKNIPVTIGINFIKALKRLNIERNWFTASADIKNGTARPNE